MFLKLNNGRLTYYLVTDLYVECLTLLVAFSKGNFPHIKIVEIDPMSPSVNFIYVLSFFRVYSS